MRLHRVPQFQPRHARPYRAHACAVPERAGPRRPGVRRWPGRRLVLGRAEVRLPCPGQLADDPPCPGRGRVVGGLLRGAAGVPAARTYAPAAGRRGRARACDGRDRGGRLPGRPWQRAHRPDQRLRGQRPALRGTQLQARPPDRRPARRQAPLARPSRAPLTSPAPAPRLTLPPPGSTKDTAVLTAPPATRMTAALSRTGNDWSTSLADCAGPVPVPGPRRRSRSKRGCPVGALIVPGVRVCCDSCVFRAAGWGRAAVVCVHGGRGAGSGGGAASGQDRVGCRRGVPGRRRVLGIVRAGAAGCAVSSRAGRLRLSCLGRGDDRRALVHPVWGAGARACGAAGTSAGRAPAGSGSGWRPGPVGAVAGRRVGQREGSGLPVPGGGVPGGRPNRLAPLLYAALACLGLDAGGGRWLGRFGGAAAVGLYCSSGAALLFAWRDYMPTFADASLIAAGSGALLWAVLAAEASERRRTWAGLAGFVMLEAATFTRYTDIVVLGCAAVAVLAVWWRGAARLPFSAVGWWLASVAVFGVGVAVFDGLVYGGLLTTGYRPGEISFGLRAIAPNLRYMPAHLLQAMPVLVLGLVSLGWITVRWIRLRGISGDAGFAVRRDLWVGVALAASWFAVWGLYAAYFWTANPLG